MWRAGLLFAILSLVGCGSAAGVVITPSHAAGTAVTPTNQPFSGFLRIVPSQVAFKNDRSGSQLVRVWQRGFKGQYRARNECTNVSVHLVHYTRTHATVWKVRPTANGRRSCVVIFSGNTGPRGTARLKISVLTL